MEVKPGYKQTEVGVIPELWSCSPLGNIIASGTTITYGIVQAGPHVENGIPYIKTGDMSGSNLPTEGLARTSKQIAARYPRSTVRSGDLVYSIRASVGAVHRVPPELDSANLTRGTARISPNTSVDSRYLLNALRSTACQDWINLHTKGTTYREITLETLRNLPVPLPPTKAEQEAIAEALSDADALIESLEQLLAKKRLLKQGAMQELLTGKKRLPGFSGEWEVKRIAEIASPSSEKNSAGERLTVLTCSKHLGFVDSLGYFKNQVFSKDTRGYKIIKRGQIGYPSNHVEEGSIGLQDVYDVALVSPIYVVFSVTEEVDSYFLHRLLKLGRVHTTGARCGRFEGWKSRKPNTSVSPTVYQSSGVTCASPTGRCSTPFCMWRSTGASGGACQPSSASGTPSIPA